MEYAKVNNASFNFKTYNDNQIYLLEIVSVDCSHCKDMIQKHISKMSDMGIKLVESSV